jgi:hypothetical protein
MERRGGRMTATDLNKERIETLYGIIEENECLRLSQCPRILKMSDGAFYGSFLQKHIKENPAFFLFD